MSQFAWESGGAEGMQAAPQAGEPEAQAGTLALSPDDFSALEERILRAVDLVKRGRAAHAVVEERAEQAEIRLREQALLFEQSQKEVNALRAERDHMRQRVEGLLAQLDALEL